MRRIILYLLVFATLLPSVSQWGVIAYYHANKDYIARVLCQNRDKPQLHCDGKCYLAKKLKASQDRQDRETTESVRNAPTITLFCSDRFSFDFTPVFSLTDRSAPASTYQLQAYSAPLSPVFQPPGC